MKTLDLLVPFPFLWASTFYLYYRASIFIAPGEILRPLIVLSAVLVALTALVYQINKDSKSTGILLTIIVIGAWSYEWFSLIVVATTAIGLLILRARKYPVGIGQVINLIKVVGLFLLVYTGYLTMASYPRLPASYYSNAKHPELVPGLAVPPDAVLPDIYYIVLDGYARADVLQELYGFDNSEFLTFLEGLGFIVPNQSRSNYPKTVLSVASTFNMGYIEDFAPGLNDQIDWWLMSPFIDNSRSRLALESLGYETISIETGWSITDNSSSDLYIHAKPLALTDFENYFLNSTPMSLAKPLLSKVAFVSSYASHRELLNAELELLADVPAKQGPKFTFVHILAPHPPFTFGVGNTFVEPPYPFTLDDANDFPSSTKEYREGYVGKLRFLNQQLELILGAIITNSKVPPIVIIQADHGAGSLTDFSSVENTCLKERFAIFAAYFLPGASSSLIPDDITPVNVFRIIFNEYFGAKLPLLERAHYFTSTAYIYDGEDVTQKVESCERN